MKMKFVDGLNLLDNLKEFVQTSLPIRQKLQQSKIDHRVDVQNKERREIKKDEDTEVFEPIGEFDLFGMVKEEILDEGKIYTYIPFFCLISPWE